MAALCEQPLRARSGVSAERRQLFSLNDPSTRNSSSHASPPTPQPPSHHLPRLAPEFYRAFAVVHWTITLERRATGWLDDSLHAHFRELLLHTAAREGLFCPAYVLMPDHPSRVDGTARGHRPAQRHEVSPQTSGDGTGAPLAHRRRVRVAKAIARQVCCARRIACAGRLRRRASTCWTIRAARDWASIARMEVPWSGSAGYPFLHPMAEDFWEQFWKLYEQQREPDAEGTAASRLRGEYGGSLPKPATA